MVRRGRKEAFGPELRSGEALGEVAAEFRDALTRAQRLLQEAQLLIEQARGAVLPGGLAAGAADAAGAATDDPLDARPLLAGSPVFTAYCFGRFELVNHGSAVALPGKKGPGVLKYLLVAGGRKASRDRLLEVFWPDVPAGPAAHRLEAAVSAVRGALGPAAPGGTTAILYDQGTYFLNPALPITTDLDAFRSHLEAGRRLERSGQAAEAARAFEAAARLYRGDLLEDDLYEDWTALERARLEDHYLLALSRLASHAAAEGRWAESADWARRIVERDAVREDAHRHLMICYARLGRRGDALQQFRHYRRAIHHELGLDPTPAMRRLHEAILEGAPPDRI